MSDDNIKFIKKIESQVNKDQMERFVSYGEIFKELGFNVDDRPDLYDRGWYKGENMTWTRYLFERYKEEHPDDPNIGYYDSMKLFEYGWDVPGMEYLDF